MIFEIPNAASMTRDEQIEWMAEHDSFVGNYLTWVTAYKAGAASADATQKERREAKQ